MVYYAGTADGTAHKACGLKPVLARITNQEFLNTFKEDRRAGWWSA